MIELVNISKTYKGKNNKLISALTGISVSFEEKGLVFIVGRSGSGKTSLLNIIGGIDNATNGDISYKGVNYSNYKANDFDSLRSNSIGFIFQSFNLINDYTVYENVALPVKLEYYDKKDKQQKVEAALASVNLSGYENRKADELSGGQQQRVAIARTLMKEYDVILCDEPTGNLDGKTSEEILELLKNISKNKLVLVVTHKEADASIYADRIIRLNEGEITEDIGVHDFKKGKNENEDIEKDRRNKSIFEIMKFSKDNIMRNRFVSLILIVMMIVSYTLLISFYAINDFDENKALLNTIDYNNEKALIITNYYDAALNDYEGIPTGKGELGGLFSVTENEKSKIEKVTDKIITLYPSYYFRKNLQDFTDSKKDPPTTPPKSYFTAFGFTEAVIVTDFSKFSMNVMYGEKPKASNEILIYDYMAYNLIAEGIVDVDEIGNFPSTMLIDRDTGLELIISGILKSDYIKYKYIEDYNGHSNIDFEKMYLMSLQKIFGGEELLEIIEKEQDYFSIHNISIHEMGLGNDVVSHINLNNKKIIFLNNIYDLNIIGDINPMLTNTGILLSDRFISEIYNIPFDEITDTLMNIKNKELEPEILSAYYTAAPEQAVAISTFIGLLGIYASSDETNNSYDLLYWQSNDFDWYNKNGAFRQYYILLGNDYKENIKIIEAFSLPKHEDDFYSIYSDYYSEGYFIYTPYLFIIDEASNFLKSIKAIGEKFLYITCIASIIGLCLLTVYSVKRNRYKIGILKSLGTRNWSIVSIFGLESIIISLIAFVFSIITSKVLISSINHEFVKELQYSIVFFDIQIYDYINILLFSIPIIIVSISVPLIKLFMTSPINIIKQSKQRL